MVMIDFEEHIATKRFEYGNHEIVVHVSVEYDSYGTRKVMNENAKDLRYNNYFYRIVEIKAYESGEYDVKNESYVALNAEQEKELIVNRHLFKENETKTKVYNKVIPIREQIFKTAEEVFESLDTMYEFTTKDISIDVDVATEEVSAETSWVEVEDDIDRISQEIDNLTA